MKTHTLYFTNHRTPSFLSLELTDAEAAEEYVHSYFQFDPVPPSGILSATATPPQVAAIRRAEAKGRDYDVTYLAPACPEAPARIKVRTYASVLSNSEPQGVIYHFPDGRRVMRHPNGQMVDLFPLGGGR